MTNEVQNTTNNQPNSPVAVKTVVLDGASGYLGNHLAYSLVRQGYAVRCLVHKRANPFDITFLNGTGAQVYQANLHDEAGEGKDAFCAADVAIHLIGSIAPKRGESLTELHVTQSQSFVRLCQRAQIDKVIMVTALGTAFDAASLYHRTKWQAEEVVRQSGLNAIFLRPSLLIGRSAGRRNSKLVERFLYLIATKKFIPLVNGGKNKIQPLYINDMVKAVEKCITDIEAYPGIKAPILNLGGPEILTMKKFVELLMTLVGKDLPIINLPPPLAYLIAAVAQIVQETPILSQDQVTISLQDNICQENHLTELLAINALSVHNALLSYSS